ncbi:MULTISPECIES: cupin domain-containing protein [Gracilibacillus]|uniref:cupin domain-containing protein n=1 Tax=Gracilibacillus TaxID=74385 RepID=UPI0008259AB7|nr:MULTISPECIES: cupin domain-containing protein [Gracilibacillus]
MTLNQWEQAEPGVKRKVHQPGKDLMMMEVIFEEGAQGASHSHPHEQLTYCLEGRLLFTVGQQETVMEEGESLQIPSNAIHGVTALTKSKLLDVFTPIREDLVSGD